MRIHWLYSGPQCLSFSCVHIHMCVCSFTYLFLWRQNFNSGCHSSAMSTVFCSSLFRNSSIPLVWLMRNSQVLCTSLSITYTGFISVCHHGVHGFWGANSGPHACESKHSRSYLFVTHSSLKHLYQFWSAECVCAKWGVIRPLHCSQKGANCCL